MAAVNTKWWRPMGGVGFGENTKTVVEILTDT